MILRRTVILQQTFFTNANFLRPVPSIELERCIFNHGSCPIWSSSSLHNEESLKSRILKFKCHSRQGVKSILEEWIEEGRRKVHAPELKRISLLLIKSKRFKHALEIYDWMEAQERFRMLPNDHAIKLDLITKVHGLPKADNYFSNISSTACQKASFMPLLCAYVREKNTVKAEALIDRLHKLGLLVNCHPYNEVMKLYIATSQFDKVHDVILQMKWNKIPRNFLSYNIWINARGEMSGVASAEMAYEEMAKDQHVRVGWSTLVTLANIYLRAGLTEKATMTLRYAEKRLSTDKRLGYNFLITLYTSLKNKEEVLRLWDASKEVEGRITTADYKGMISCLVKLGDLAGAEKIFKEWESKCRKYDIRVSNVLLGAYARKGLIGKVESLHLRTREKGGHPNAKTWEILMEGWIKCQNMDKAIDSLKKWLAAVDNCNGKPSQDIIIIVAEYLEKCGSFEDAEWYLAEIHRLGLASLALYKVFLRMQLDAQRPASNIMAMMEKDAIGMDDEMHSTICDLKKLENIR